MTSTGSGKRPSASTHLVSSAITIMRSEAAATIFSRNSAPPPPLIRLSAGSISSAPSTVRSSRSISSSVVSGNAALLGLGAGRFRGRHADHLQAGAHLFAEQVDEMLGGRAGAEPELHAVAHMLQRARRRLPFQCVHVHAAMPLKLPPALARGAYLASFSARGTAAIQVFRRMPMRDLRPFQRRTCTIRAGPIADCRMTSPRIVVFDLDGTLVDTAPDLIAALNFVLDREGLPPVPLHPRAT